MKREIELIYTDGLQEYKFFGIKQNTKGELLFFPSSFNSRVVGTHGNHFTYHEQGYYNTTLKGNNGFCFQFKGPTLRPISEFKGVMQVLCLSKGAFEADLVKTMSSARRSNQHLVITRSELDEIHEPNINILLLEPNKKDVLDDQEPYSVFLKEKHVIRYFTEFSPWVVLFVGSGSAKDRLRPTNMSADETHKAVMSSAGSLELVRMS